MKNFNLKICLNLVFICILIGFTSCIEDQIIPEEENVILESRGKSSSTKGPAPFDISTPSNSTTGIQSTVYVRWDPKVLSIRRDEIRATYSDPNGYMYLVSYEVCPNDPHVEIWQVIFNMIIPPTMEDQTPDPLATLPDHDDEMSKPTHNNICN